MILTTTARQLMAVDRSRRLRESTFTRIVPPAAAVGNLLLCATFEPLLREDAAGHFLALFLLVESALLVILNISYFGGKTAPVLRKVRIFPVTPSERYCSTIAIEMRRRIVLALMISSATFLAIFFRASVVIAASSVMIYLILAVAVEFGTSAIALLLLRTPHPPASALALGGGTVLLLTTGLMVFGITELVAAIPLVNWASAGVLAGSKGDIPGVLVNAGYIAASGAGAILIGSRYS